MFRHQLARFVILAIVSGGTIFGQLLSFPFNNKSVTILQGWKYAGGFFDGKIHAPDGAIDFALFGSAGTLETFEVLAAADGLAVWDDDPDLCPGAPDGPCRHGYGNMVIIRHNEVDSTGRNLFTLYAHLSDGSIPSCSPEDPPGSSVCIPKLGRKSTAYDQWGQVQREQTIGMAGYKGRVCSGYDIPSCTHLHFEVFRGSYGQKKTLLVDPYDISDPQDMSMQFKRDHYPGGGDFAGCGVDFLWGGRTGHFTAPAGAPQLPIHPSGTLVKLEGDPKVFLIQNQSRRPIFSTEIPSVDLLRELYPNGGFSFGNVIVISADELIQYPEGLVVDRQLASNGQPIPDGQVVKKIGGDEIAVMSGGMLRPFKDYETFQWLGYLECHIRHVTPVVYDSFNRGAVVDGHSGGPPVDPPLNERPTAAFLMSFGGQSAPNGQTLKVSVEEGAEARIEISIAPSSDPDGTVEGGEITVDGVPFLSFLGKPTVGIQLGEGQHQIEVVVIDDDGLASAPATGTIVFGTSNQLPEAGFLMSAGGRSARDGQTLNLAVLVACNVPEDGDPDGTVEVTFSAEPAPADPALSFDPDGTIVGYEWRFSGTLVSSVPVFMGVLGCGDHLVTLKVTDNRGSQAVAQAHVVVSEIITPSPGALNLDAEVSTIEPASEV